MAQRFLRKKDGSDPTLYIFTNGLYARGDMEIVDEETAKAEAGDTGKIGEEEQIGPYIIRKYAPGWYEVLEVVERKLRKADAESLVLQMMAASEAKGVTGESLGTAGTTAE
jgi:hypothetical protein